MNPARHISLTEAKARLESLYDVKLRALVPDRLTAALQESGAVLEWTPLPGWDCLDDEVLLETTSFIEAIEEAELLVIAEVAFGKTREAAVIAGSDLRVFARDHRDNYGESLFSGDLIIVSMKNRRIYMFHHEGFYTTVEPE